MLQTKALYNLFRINARDDASLKGDPWALEDFRMLELGEIWNRLALLGIALERSSFLKFSEEVDSPEELTELLVNEDLDPKTVDRIYLLLFELWRRLIPERPSLSIFCDELDYQIDRYDSGFLESDEPIQDGLANLADVLEEHVDAGMDPKKAFASLSDYCAHDLESFLYDYILDQENTGYAAELFELFEPYMVETAWTELLKARLIGASDVAEANQMIKKIVSKDRELDYLLEALRFLVVSGEAEVFRLTMQKVLAKVTAEEELQEAMELAADYYRRLDCDVIEQAILRIKEEREGKKVTSLESAIQKLEGLISSR